MTRLVYALIGGAFAPEWFKPGHVMAMSFPPPPTGFQWLVSEKLNVHQSESANIGDTIVTITLRMWNGRMASAAVNFDRCKTIGHFMAARDANARMLIQHVSRADATAPWWGAKVAELVSLPKWVGNPVEVSA